MKNYSTLSVTGEMQILTTMTDHYIMTRLAEFKIQNFLNTKVGKDVK